MVIPSVQREATSLPGPDWSSTVILSGYAPVVLGHQCNCHRMLIKMHVPAVVLSSWFLCSSLQLEDPWWGVLVVLGAECLPGGTQ